MACTRLSTRSAVVVTYNYVTAPDKLSYYAEPQCTAVI